MRTNGAQKRRADGAEVRVLNLISIFLFVFSGGEFESRRGITFSLFFRLFSDVYAVRKTTKPAQRPDLPFKLLVRCLFEDSKLKFALSARASDTSL